MDFIFGSSNNVLGDTITVFGDTVEVKQLSYADEVTEVFDMGYYLLTGKTPQAEGWLPRILFKADYDAVVDECCGGNPLLKSMVGFCCLDPQSGAGLELIIDGERSLPSVLLTLAHEAGHARQHVLNPGQSQADSDTDIGALREGEAFAFEVALGRILGEATGLNVSRYPDRPYVRSFIDSWVVGLKSDINDLSQPHQRGLILLWLAVLKDPELGEQRTELLANDVLSADSLMAVHNRLIGLIPATIETYVDVLAMDMGQQQNTIIGTLADRLSTAVRIEGFVRFDLTPVLVP